MIEVLGIGGVFVKCEDPDAVAAWYVRVLGLTLEASFAGVVFPPLPRGYTVWSAFPGATEYMDPGTVPFMVNFVVADLDAALAHVRAEGETVLGEQNEAFGRFAWLLDPNGCKIELWEPAAEGSAAAA